ncbi:hypothetical protein OH76DRAFT_1406334 [Lentinus brumalis]|uniref:Uncharacterized protein n=1 Tax=Lentinus brumalis TaxID=2498619 RepID=A0A371D377_9APHY|nr:hypothetical protein OH76DRAFT_1406334 [Polyporus brumalis]
MKISPWGDLGYEGTPQERLKHFQHCKEAEYERHLVPISWSDFPIEYIQELQETRDKLRSNKKSSRWDPLGWNTHSSGDRFYHPEVSLSDRLRATQVPVFHYGILFSETESELYGKQCYGKQLQAAGEHYDGHPLPANTPSIVNWLNRRLLEKGFPESVEFDSGEPYDKDERIIIYLISTQSLDESSFDSGEPYDKDERIIIYLISTQSLDESSFDSGEPYDKDERIIIYLISTQSLDESSWKDGEQLKSAFALLRDELQLSEDRQPMWYFDREFFGPENAGYKEFDVDRMVGSELLKRFPEHVQAAIRAGTDWQSSKPSD